MPLLQYKCPKCEKCFEEIVKSCEVEVFCPDCNVLAQRLYSGQMFTSTGKTIKKCSGNCKNCSGCQ